jgi:hypothetical protein
VAVAEGVNATATLVEEIPVTTVKVGVTQVEV